MEQEQLVRILEQYYQLLLHKAFHLLRHRQDAEDALQSAYLKAWLRRDSLRVENHCLAWLKRIVYNECMEVLRRRQKQPLFLSDAQMQVVPSQQNDITRCLERMLLDSMLSQLPVKRRRAIFYYYTMGCNIAETAQKMRLSEGTVKSHLFYTRRTLREKLQQF